MGSSQSIHRVKIDLDKRKEKQQKTAEKKKDKGEPKTPTSKTSPLKEEKALNSPMSPAASRDDIDRSGI